ncbi:UDP-3-O-[3-hydroxymyristoyl] glucosamine N-acyltransferase [Tamilnaduibacter salinus]|uniref:UDP-3-O-acylglucosamine N-acyltransferase n=1 Tax=Tamilnaduibacter salinus TaxID=1484056 RepID=A0A2A2I119_9GAMM|nr:UDP-3-O-(3-hydroxymyristoyl)glucosamine N-acyltransferase [Tamilnaduibacter salinus]PAV24835.1 UDP-3-O-(3-hydroxymyristoyl)glucosamine N-acyltransferase [Tamilnaduibacter salinus]PVY69794.1 UDP-3-O-[3-hydroxymyristoyl] glucosamine N-acyltransferase [Tamilnaduibacter salinus]
MSQQHYTLRDIAEALGAELRGDDTVRIGGVATLQSAQPGQISFLANPRYAGYLQETRASAVILSSDVAEASPTNVLLLDNPYLGYAQLSHWFDPLPVAEPGIHPSAVVDEGAEVADSASIGPQAVIAAGAVVGDQAIVGPGSVVGERSVVGQGTRLQARVTLYHDVVIGRRCLLESGAVIGSNGFGFANEKGVWHRIAQIAGVVIGDDVEVGANTTIDRGALEPTRIGDGVKLDNLVQIGHNVQVGDHTAMAAMVGIAGSTVIGRHCVFGGATGVSGHLTIADGVQLTGMTMVTHSIRKPGVYSSGLAADENRKWQKNAVRFRQLDKLARRLRDLEKKLLD